MINFLKGITGAYIAYPLAEKIEKRAISSKVKELEKYYKLSFEERKIYAQDKLLKTLNFAHTSVPYYKELFESVGFNPNNIVKDMKYLEDIPYLTKDIIREQADRMFAAPLKNIKHHLRKTGGSTGISANIYYDQVGLDYSAAVTRYCRINIGATVHKSELHFAASFVKPPQKILLSKDDVKNFALNRSNIFFDRLDGFGLKEIWNILIEKNVYLVHGHPSTLYALACYVDEHNLNKKVFEVFESSGELLQDYMREKIEKVFSCRIINRYGSAEFGVIGYELDRDSKNMQILDSEGWPESRVTSDGNEFVFTGFHNRLMPLIRYATGDMAKVLENDKGFYMTDVVGRIHDMVNINGIEYPTHTIMDVLDHKVGGIQEFQIDVRFEKPLLRVAIEQDETPENISFKIKNTWLGEMDIEFVDIGDFIRVGERAKFRHVVQ